jgi:hypothetical protein
MKEFLTDNPFIAKEIPGSSLAYQLYDWRVSIDREDPYLSSRFLKKWKSSAVREKLGSCDSVSAIVAPSNYKMIYDLLTFSKETGKRVRFYSWNGYPVRKYIPDEEKIAAEFERYLQRGYLSRIHYFELGKWNLNRIEQFVLSLTATAFGEKVVKKEKIKAKKIEVVDLITKISIAEKIGIGAAIERLLYHYRKRNIADPFLNGKVKIVRRGSKPEFWAGLDDPGITDFHLLVSLVSKFIPLVDVLRTIAFLEKSEYAKFGPESIRGPAGMEARHVSLYSDYISPRKWKEVYSTGTFSFSGILPAIAEEPPSFKCPICGTLKYRTDPLWFRCANPACGFKIKREIKPFGESMRMKADHFKRLVTHGKVMIKNKRGGYSVYLLKKGPKGYYVYPEISNKP